MAAAPPATDRLEEFKEAFRDHAISTSKRTPRKAQPADLSVAEECIVQSIPPPELSNQELTSIVEGYRLGGLVGAKEAGLKGVKVQDITQQPLFQSTDAPKITHVEDFTQAPQPLYITQKIVGTPSLESYVVAVTYDYHAPNPWTTLALFVNGARALRISKLKGPVSSRVEAYDWLDKGKGYFCEVIATPDDEKTTVSQWVLKCTPEDDVVSQTIAERYCHLLVTSPGSQWIPHKALMLPWKGQRPFLCQVMPTCQSMPEKLFVENTYHRSLRKGIINAIVQDMHDAFEANCFPIDRKLSNLGIFNKRVVHLDFPSWASFKTADVKQLPHTSLMGVTEPPEGQGWLWRHVRNVTADNKFWLHAAFGDILRTLNTAWGGNKGEDQQYITTIRFPITNSSLAMLNPTVKQNPFLGIFQLMDTILTKDADIKALTSTGTVEPDTSNPVELRALELRSKILDKMDTLRDTLLKEIDEEEGIAAVEEPSADEGGAAAP